MCMGGGGKGVQVCVCVRFVEGQPTLRMHAATQSGCVLSSGILSAM